MIKIIRKLTGVLLLAYLILMDIQGYRARWDTY
jgi:hypothetical protein